MNGLKIIKVIYAWKMERKVVNKGISRPFVKTFKLSTN